MKNQNLTAVDRALVALDYALVVAEPLQYIAAARRELLNIKIDLNVSVDAQETLAELEGTNGPPERYTKKENKRKAAQQYVAITDRQMNQALGYAKGRGLSHTAPEFPCPTCGAPPWHRCNKVSTRGVGDKQVGKPLVNNYHEARRGLASGKNKGAADGGEA